MTKCITVFPLIALVGCAAMDDRKSVFPIEDLDSPPKAVYHPNIPYPEIGRETRIHPEAVVSLTIEKDGRVSDVVLEESTDVEFGEAAVRTVESYRFEPVAHKGKIVRARIRIPVVYHVE